MRVDFDVGGGASPNSCCAKFTRYVQDEGTIQVAKSVFWLLGAAASIVWIPIPYLSGFAAGGALFMEAHSIIQHPNSTCMQSSWREIARSRTWKHIVSGAAISAASWGGGNVGIESENKPIIVGCIVVAAALGFIVGLKLAYSNVLFDPSPNRDQRPLVVNSSE